MRGVPLQPGDHAFVNPVHRAACRECRDRYNAWQRNYRLTRGKTRATRGPIRRKEDFVALGELYGDGLRDAILRHLQAYPNGLAARDIARALGMSCPDGTGQTRVKYQLRRLAGEDRAVSRDEPRADGSARTCRCWYPAGILEAVSA